MLAMYVGGCSVDRGTGRQKNDFEGNAGMPSVGSEKNAIFATVAKPPFFTDAADV